MSVEGEGRECQRASVMGGEASCSLVRVTLDLCGTEFSVEIPAELGSLSNLKWLYLNGNELSGCVPGSLEQQLDFRDSDLGGLPFC